MKKLFLLLVTAAMFSGCKTSYDVTLSDGRKISGVSKPVLDEAKNQYHFKTAEGRDVKVSVGRVRTIEPHGESSEPTFVSPTQKKK